MQSYGRLVSKGLVASRRKTIPILGAHMSIAGGYHKAIERAVEAGCDCVQIFTKNNNQWRAKPITDDEASRFREAFDESRLRHVLSHASYLINLASPKDDLWSKSIDALHIELQRAELLGVPHVVFHPGSHTTSTEDEGVARIVDALDEIHAREPNCETRFLLETTAGQGTCLGWRFEHLGEIIGRVQEGERLGVCLDTCHVFAAGYPLTPSEAYAETFQSFDAAIGLERLEAIHVNDSKRELGSRVDRHEHIGDGEIGSDGFRSLVNDARFQEIPMYLETAKEDAPDGRAWDEVNLERLHGFVVAR